MDGKKAGALQDASGWQIELSSSTKVSAFKPQHPTNQMNSIGSLTVSTATKTPKQNDDELFLKLSVFGAFLTSVEGLPAECEELMVDFDDNWLSVPQYREHLLSTIPSHPERVYWSSHTGNNLLSEFEGISEARAGIRREIDTFELTIAFPNGNAASYNNWSDGQKSLFTILSAIHIDRPDIYIFDEVENFLHPMLMSRVLDYLKNNVKQTVLATHHPHIIFGNLVDEVFFIEKTVPKNARYPTVLKKQLNQPAPSRTITRLSSDIEKLAITYRLFDVKDAALLATASLVTKAVDHYI